MSPRESTDFGRIDDAYRLLANRHRRATLAFFADSSSDVASLDEIAEGISEHGGEERARIHLHHYALPRLDDADVVEYDARSNTVRYRGHPDLDVVKESIVEL